MWGIKENFIPLIVILLGAVNSSSVHARTQKVHMRDTIHVVGQAHMDMRWCVPAQLPARSTSRNI